MNDKLLKPSCQGEADWSDYTTFFLVEYRIPSNGLTHRARQRLKTCIQCGEEGHCTETDTGDLGGEFFAKRRKEKAGGIVGKSKFTYFLFIESRNRYDHDTFRISNG